MNFTTKTPDLWAQNYARERARRRRARLWNAVQNVVLCAAFLALLYCVLLFCSILEPGGAAQMP